MSEISATDSTLEIKYLLVIFIIIIGWTFMSVDAILLFFGMILESALAWLTIASILLLAYAIPLGLIVRQMKWAFTSNAPQWEFNTRYLTFEEFLIISEEYNSKYVLFTTRPIFRKLLLVGLVIAFALVLPFILAYIHQEAILFLPQVFALVSIILGVAYSTLFLSWIPGVMDAEFPVHSAKALKSGIRQLYDIPALVWIGVRVQIGYWGGFYTIRTPQIVAKIEGLEGALTIATSLAQDGSITELWVEKETETLEMPSFEQLEHPNATEIIALLREVITWYRSETGDNELLNDVMLDLGLIPED